MSQHSLRSLRVVALAACVAAGTAPVGAFAEAAEGVLIRLSEAQIRAAGIHVEAAQSAGEADSSGGRRGVRLTGQVVTPGNRAVVVPSAVAGQLELVYVHVGAKVRAGEPLARLFSADLATLQRTYLHAKATADLAAGRLSRDQALFNEGIIAESRLRESRAALDMARATQQEQHRLLGLAGYSGTEIESLKPESISTRVTLRAPAGGVVLEQPVPVGQHVEPGATLFRVAPPGEWWLELEATKSQAGGIQLGDAVRVNGCRLAGRVIAVGTQVRSTSQTLPVRAELPDGSTCLSPNQYIEADVVRSVASSDLVSVPASALVRNSDREYVFIQSVAGFQPMQVIVERREGEHVLLRAAGGISPGTRIATSGLVALKGAWLGLGPQPASGGAR